MWSRSEAGETRAMPWKETGPMERRIELIKDWKDGQSITALGENYGVSRKTIYKWIERQANEGSAGLADRSRAPHTSPQSLSQEIGIKAQRLGGGDFTISARIAKAPAAVRRVRQFLKESRAE